MLLFRPLLVNEINPDLFHSFRRHQVVSKCWRFLNHHWVLQDYPFVDDWSHSDFLTLCTCLQNTLLSGGFVFAAFLNGSLKGFTSVEPTLFGSDLLYLDLSSLHVSEELRNSGIGSRLFLAAKNWAKLNGADKLYISAHPAAESIAFYRKMGCVDAQFAHPFYTLNHPLDCQLECLL